MVDRQSACEHRIRRRYPQPHLYINAHECVGAATETKFDCREAKGLFYTLQTNRMQREINDGV